MSATRGIFEHLFLLARPAAGKSELIAFLRGISDEDRSKEFHVGRIEEVDDFVWLWESCEEDDRREARGEKRLVSTKTFEGYNITKPGFRGSLVGRFNETIGTRFLANPSFYGTGTVVIEFARGKDDGFRRSLESFDPEILRRGAILYIQVSFEESFRRNSARYRPGEEESILFHKVPDHDMLGFFFENDWDELTGRLPEGHIRLAGIDVPFVSMPNEPESTDPVELAGRYRRALGRLWELRSAR